MSPKILVKVGIIILICAGVVAVLRFSTPEDTWLCQNGQWVKHGNPSAAKPAQGCGNAEASSPQNLADAYIRAHISELSLTKEALGGKFYVTNITFLENGRALVEYEDGHISLKANVVYEVNNSQVKITSFSETDGPLVITMAKILSKKYSQPENTIAVTITAEAEKFAKGTVNFTNQAGGGLWFAASTEKGWELAFDGNGIIPCDAANKYNLPTDMVPQCIDVQNNNNLVTR